MIRFLTVFSTLMLIHSLALSQVRIEGRQTATEVVSELPDEIISDFSQANYHEAEEKLRAYVAMHPNNYIAVFMLGKTFALQDKYQQSLEQFGSAKDLQKKYNIDDVSLYNASGWAHYQVGNIEDAITDLNTVLSSTHSEDESEKDRALTNLGTVMLYTREYDKARKYFSTAYTDFGNPTAKENFELVNRLQNIQEAVAKERNLSIGGKR